MPKQTQKTKWLAAGLLAVFAAVGWSTSSFAWGPDRETFTMESPADYITFNSITNNNVMGDERNFVRVAPAGAGVNFSDEVKIEPGKEYEVYIFYHNDGKSSLNPSGKGIASQTVVSSQFPATVNSSAKGKVSAIITSPYATPQQVWDEAYFTTDSSIDIVLRYVDASAKIYNAGKVNGSVLSEELFNKGTFIGINSLDGSIPACSEYSGHIIYRVRAEQVGASVNKTVSLDGNNFSKKVTANPGDVLTYRVEFKNSGTTELKNVTFYDRLPTGVTLVSGTTKLIDNVGNETLLSDLIGQNGYNTGLYGIGVSAVLTYQVRVNDDILSGTNCGVHSYANKIYVDHDDGEISDTASFEVENTNNCKDVPSELPKTGPTEIAVTLAAIVTITVGAIYWRHSQKELKRLQDEATGGKSAA